MRIVDSHMHLWRIGAPGHEWPDESLPAIHRDFLPDDFADATGDLDVAGAVLVQSQPDDRDTDWMLALAAGTPAILGVVGWAAFDAPDAAARIATLATRPKLVGLRPMLQGIADIDWILSPALDPAFDAMIRHDLRFDALIQPRHLSVIARLADRWPALRIVVDHAAKPHAARGDLDPWRADIAALAMRPQLWCKLSGLRTEQAPGQPAAALLPYVAHLVDAFGERLMWGSDWPVLRHAGDTYGDWVTTAQTLAGDAGADMASLFEGAARDFYGLAGDASREQQE